VLYSTTITCVVEINAVVKPNTPQKLKREQQKYSMKLLKLMTYAAAGLALVNSSQADTTLYVTGSTAFRSNTHNAIKHIFSGTTLKYAWIQNAAGNATENNSSAAMYQGTVTGIPGTTTIKTHWSGSEAGVQTVAGGFTVTFLPAGTTLTAAGNQLDSSTALSDSVVPDVAMADAFQASSNFKAGTSKGSPPFGTYRNLAGHTTGLPAGNIVGIVPFKFVASDDAPGSVTNMSSQIARALFSTGKVPLSMFTGSAADQGVHAFAIGRDIDSGTRLTTFAETGLGALAVVKQYEPLKGGVRATTNGTGATGDGVNVAMLTASDFWPSETIDGITEAVGNGGYSSGGTVALVLANHNAANQFMISYLGASDAATATSNGAHELTFNGTAFDPNAIAQGDYTFWGYEHLYYSTIGVPAGPKKQIADKIALQIFNTDAPTPHYNDMAVSRKTDGAVVLPFF
jgi:hypothetical protein